MYQDSAGSCSTAIERMRSEMETARIKVGLIHGSQRASSFASITWCLLSLFPPQDKFKFLEIVGPTWMFVAKLACSVGSCGEVAADG